MPRQNAGPVSRSICDYVTTYVVAARAYNAALIHTKPVYVSSALAWIRAREENATRLMLDWGW